MIKGKDPDPTSGSPKNIRILRIRIPTLGGRRDRNSTVPTTLVGIGKQGRTEAELGPGQENIKTILWRREYTKKSGNRIVVSTR
jgi:hypothetical protein